MFELMIEDSFDSAHFLKGYPGNCKNLHGHRFRVQIFIKGDKLNDIGLLYDYRFIKQELKKVVNKLDHQVLNEILDFNPTSELLAKYLYFELQKILPSLSKITVWESEKTSTSFYI